MSSNRTPRRSSAPAATTTTTTTCENTVIQFVMKKTRLQDALATAGDQCVKRCGREYHVAGCGTDSDQLVRVYRHIAQRSQVVPRPQGEHSGAPPSYLSADQEALARAALEEQVHVMQMNNDQSDSFRKIIQGEIAASVETPWKQVEKGGASDWYVVGKVVGKGTFGRVHLAQHRVSGVKVAIKSYFRVKGASICSAPPMTVGAKSARRAPATESDALEWKRVRQEVKLMSSLQRHPGVIHFIEAFETPTQLQVVMEFVGGGSLCDLLKRYPQQRLPETKARVIFVQLCDALGALHDQNVIHRDLKLENVLLDDKLNAKIIDFGFSQLEFSADVSSAELGSKSRSQTARGVKNFCGTPSYMAPEVVSCKSYDGRLVDIWSLGIILYLMLCGKFPFQGSNLHQLYQTIRNAQLFFPANVSKDAQNLLQSIFVVDPQRRSSLSNIQDHAWLKDHQKNQENVPTRSQLFASFMMWDAGYSSIGETLRELYGLSHDVLTAALRSRRRNSVTSMIQLTMLIAEKQFNASLNDRALAKADEDLDDAAQVKKGREPPQRTKIPDEVALGASHRQQLEQLIGLVKQSLV